MVSLNVPTPWIFTLYDNDTPQCLITLEDWAAQASTQLSPTAGWGFTENAISFQLLLPSEPNELSTGFIYISLANTSTGRGFDSVGHTAGLYRNRIRVESLNTELDWHLYNCDRCLTIRLHPMKRRVWISIEKLLTWMSRGVIRLRFIQQLPSISHHKDRLEWL